MNAPSMRELDFNMTISEAIIYENSFTAYVFFFLFGFVPSLQLVEEDYILSLRLLES